MAWIRSNGIQDDSEDLDETSIDENRIEFPRFIPDDPERPDLSSMKRERARRAVIAQFI